MPPFCRFISDLDWIIRSVLDPFELRSLNKKTQFFELLIFLFSLRIESKLSPCLNKKSAHICDRFSFLSDLDWIQTCRVSYLILSIYRYQR